MRAAGLTGIPRTAGELAELEASYRPFHAADDWRGVHVDEPRWNRYAHNLAGRIRAADETAWQNTRDRLLRAAALDSSALDGLFPANPELTTMVLAGSISDPDRDDADDPVRVVAECHRRALILASEAAAEGRAVDSHLMAVLQDVITEAQATYTVTTGAGENVEVDLPRRQYKPVSNYLLLPAGELAVFAPASAVPAEMERLSGELRSETFAALHPAVQAAYAHYALTAIHPFADGNGRLARTVASIFLLRSVGVPLLVFADQWPCYYQALGYHALGAAHRAGDRQLLADYVSATAISAMDLAANLLAKPAHAPSRAGRQRRSGTSRRPPRSALDDAARALLDALAIELRELLVSPPHGVRLAIAQSQTMPAGHVESAYRVVADSGTGRYGIRVAVRADRARQPTAADLEFVALASELPGDLLPIALREIRTNELLEVTLADAYPLVLEPTVLRVRMWAQRLLGEALAPIVAS